MRELRARQKATRRAALDAGHGLYPLGVARPAGALSGFAADGN
jgi:hypothetical protein